MEMSARQGRLAADSIATRVFSLIVCYDVADDGRRADVSHLLSSLGPRVQLSVFECKVAGGRELAGLLTALREIIDPVEDQVRVYNLGARKSAPTILGQRTLEEWRDYWIL